MAIKEDAIWIQRSVGFGCILVHRSLPEAKFLKPVIHECGFGGQSRVPSPGASHSRVVDAGGVWVWISKSGVVVPR